MSPEYQPSDFGSPENQQYGVPIIILYDDGSKASRQARGALDQKGHRYFLERVTRPNYYEQYPALLTPLGSVAGVKGIEGFANQHPPEEIARIHRELLSGREPVISVREDGFDIDSARMTVGQKYRFTYKGNRLLAIKDDVGAINVWRIRAGKGTKRER